MIKAFTGVLFTAGALFTAMTMAQQDVPQGFMAEGYTQEAKVSRETARQAIETRQALFQILSFNMQPLAGMARGTEEFDPEKVARNAGRIAELAPLIPEVFEINTSGSGVYTIAKNIIWDNWGTFEEHARDLRLSAQALVEAAEAKDLPAVRTRVRQMGGACGSCHDLFRYLESDPAFPFRNHPNHPSNQGM